MSSNVPCDKKRSMFQALLSAVSGTQGDCMSYREALLPLMQLAALFTKHRFCVTEPWTHYLRVFRLGYLKGILWKINEMGLSLQGKLAAFVVKVKSELPMRLSAS